MWEWSTNDSTSPKKNLFMNHKEPKNFRKRFPAYAQSRTG